MKKLGFPPQTVKWGKKFNKKFLIWLILLFISWVSLLGYVFYPKAKIQWENFQKEKLTKNIPIVKPVVPSIPVASPTPIAIPDSARLEVPYTVQAPFANWDVHEESCEEADALMHHYYLSGQYLDQVIPLETADQEMIKMKQWQVSHYGKEPDLSVEALGKFMKDYYGYSYQVQDATQENIKKEIAKGNPVSVPVITHALQNPHYGRQPSYHILLIKGYNANGVITNDAGVKEGENYFYTWDVLFSAIDAQTPRMNQGRLMLTVFK